MHSLRRQRTWSTMEIIGGYLALTFVALFFGALLYLCLFKAHTSNRPTMSRGTGLFLLAGFLKVIAVILVDHGFAVFDSQGLNYALGGLAAVGLVVMMVGLGLDD